MMWKASAMWGETSDSEVTCTVPLPFAFSLTSEDYWSEAWMRGRGWRLGREKGTWKDAIGLNAKRKWGKNSWHRGLNNVLETALARSMVPNSSLHMRRGGCAVLWSRTVKTVIIFQPICSHNSNGVQDYIQTISHPPNITSQMDMSQKNQYKWQNQSWEKLLFAHLLVQLSEGARSHCR